MKSHGQWITPPARDSPTGSTAADLSGVPRSQFAGRFEAGLKQLHTWLKEKRLLYREDVVNGLENAPQAFIRMLEGKNIGKQLVKVSE